MTKKKTVLTVGCAPSVDSATPEGLLVTPEQAMALTAAGGFCRNVRLTVEYDGTDYVGWQFQNNGISVQERLERCLARAVGHAVRLRAAGRTDAGVHARGQAVNFYTTSRLPCKAIMMETVRRLPNDVTIVHADDVPLEFDARRWATMRWYKFHLINRTVFPTDRRFVTHVRGKLDFEAMDRACDVLEGNHDFRAFRSVECQAQRTFLSMRRPRIVRHADGEIVVDFMARSFLHNMVRIMTGALMAVGRGRFDADGMREMLETGVRPYQAVTLPPNGLFLYRVYYGDEPPAGVFPEVFDVPETH